MTNERNDEMKTSNGPSMSDLLHSKKKCRYGKLKNPVGKRSCKKRPRGKR